MTKIALLLITLSFSTFLKAQQLLSKNQQEVQQTVINFFEAISDRDSLAIKKHSTSDLRLIEYGSVWNTDTLILKTIILNTATDFKRTNTLNFINTTANKNTAWASYKLHSAITRNGKQTNLYWIESVVLVRVRKKWMLKSLHSTLTKRT